MNRRLRIAGKLLLILAGIVLFIRLIALDRERISLKQPEGEGISRQEIAILMQAFEEAGKEKGFLWEKNSGQIEGEGQEQLFLYEDYIELISLWSPESESIPVFTAKYRPDFYLLKKDWYQAYDRLLEEYGLDGEIRRKEIHILTGNENLKEEKLGEDCLLTDSGKIVKYRSEAFEDCFFSTVTAYGKEDVLLTVYERKKDAFTLKNVWLMECGAQKIDFFFQGFEISCERKSEEENKEADRETIADITFQEGCVLETGIKKERVSGKLLRAGDTELELEGRGTYAFAEDFRGYQLYDTLREIGKEELRIGYDDTDFVLENGKVCGALVVKKENMERIRVAVKTTDFSSLYHKEIRLITDCEAEITYGSYENRQRSKLEEGEELLLTKDSEYLEGDRLVVTPSVHSGKIKVLSLTRNQGIPSYRGKLEIVREKEGLLCINDVLLEEYLYSVVPSEMPASYPKEALKAQAVCARTYAYRYLLSPGLGEIGANVDDSVGYQVYNNIAENVESTKAVKETTGELLYYQDAPVSTYYYSTSCGFGTDAGVWKESNKEELPYLQASHIAKDSRQGKTEAEKMTEEDCFRQYILQTWEEDFEKNEPWYRWQYQAEKIDVEAISERIKSRYQADSSKILTFTGEGKDWDNAEEYTGKDIEGFSEIYDIKCLKRREGGVMDELLIETEEGSYKVISEYNIRYVLSQGGSVVRQDRSEAEAGQLLPSAYLVIDTVKKDENVIGYTIFGGGYGHGVGLSQNGARAMGNAGMKYEEMAAFFYPGCEIEKRY